MVAGMTETTVPLSAFNDGKAGEIFAEVRHSGTRLVVGDDDSPVCMIVPPETYIRMSGEFYDRGAMAVAGERLNHIDRSRLVSEEEFDKRFGFTEEDLKGWEDIELE